MADPLASESDTDALRQMTHLPPDPRAEEVARRVQAAGQNLYNTWFGAAERLGKAATSGTLNVTDPLAVQDAFNVAQWATGGKMPFAKAGTLGTGGGKITAYHGSPHDFERFDISKIGTGEGAQAYGRGLYFAEKEGTAQSYRDNLATDPRDELSRYIDGIRQQSGQGDATFDAVKTGLQRSDYGSLRLAATNDDIVRDIVTAIQGTANDGTVSPQGLKAFERLDKALPKLSGKMYQVAINAEPEHFLDWDKPLSEQSDHVKNVVSGLFKGNEEIQSALPNATGETVVNRLMPMHGIGRGAGVDQKLLSDALRQAGIPGIRYLDQGSRAGGTGTRNYVVFNDQIIDILKKYGIAGLIAAGAYHHQDKQQ